MPRENGDDEADYEVQEKEEFKRPMGRKRKMIMELKYEVDCKKLKVMEASLAEEVKKNKIIEQNNEILLFTSQRDNSDPVVRGHMEIKRGRALEQLKASERTEASSQNTFSLSPSKN